MSIVAGDLHILKRFTAHGVLYAPGDETALASAGLGDGQLLQFQVLGYVTIDGRDPVNVSAGLIPVPGGPDNAGKVPVVNEAGTGYTLSDAGGVGPKGDKGDKGDTGDTGPKGDTGDPGETPTLADVLSEGADAGAVAITNLADPSDDQDAATKAYVDEQCSTLTMNPQSTTTYTLDPSDSGKKLLFTNGSSISVTVPNSLPAGFNCLIEQAGAGTVTVSAGSGTTLHNRQSQFATAGQYATIGVVVNSNAGSAAVATVTGDTA